MTPNVRSLVRTIREAGGDPYLIGGCVRDYVMGIPPKDIDIEVFGMQPDALERALDDTPGVRSIDYVGAHFGVYKVGFDDGTVMDVSIPRTESKRGTGHTGFDVSPSPDLSLWEAVQRRDFTMNALMATLNEDAHAPRVIDPDGRGWDDIKNGVLRHIGPQFKEDPLRVLRAMQFAARFDMKIDWHTVKLCTNMLPEARTLPKERVWGEWEKWARMGRVPSKGLDVLVLTGWNLLYKNLAVMQITPQDKEWHPEGNVWEHTKQAVDQAARIATRDGVNDEDRTVLVFAALLHDIGKVNTTEQNGDGRITSHGHAEEGVLLADMFLRDIGSPDRIRERVISLVGEHMWGADGVYTQRGIRRLANRLAKRGNTVEDLARLMEADSSGRAPLVPDLTRIHILVNEAIEMGVKNAGPEPILMGRHLIERGYAPGPAMGNLLKCAFERQLDGTFTDFNGAIAWLATREGCTHA